MSEPRVEDVKQTIKRLIDERDEWRDRAERAEADAKRLLEQLLHERRVIYDQSAYAKSKARLAKAVEKMRFRLEATEREHWGVYGETFQRAVADNIRDDLAELEAGS